MSSRRTTRDTRRRPGPPMVLADREDGCESQACYIAKLFYRNCIHHIKDISNRDKLKDYFIKSHRYWIPAEILERGDLRHFDQVLYALVNDGKVCRVKKTSSGNHIVLWAINDFHLPTSHYRPRNTPRRRINVPKRDDEEHTDRFAPIFPIGTPPGTPPPLTLEDLNEDGEL